MPSVFYPDSGPILPFLFYEAFTEVQNEDKDIELGSAISRAYEVCHGKSPRQRDVEKIADRLVQEAKEVEQRAKEQAGKNQRDKPIEAKRKTYGGFLLDWISELRADEICLFVADFDVREAKRLYSEEDKWKVVKISELKSAYVWETARVTQEAVLFGMGGGYKGHTQEEGTRTVNLSEMSGPVPTAELAKFGLMKPN